MGVTLGPSHLREEHRLKVSENRVLGGIFWPNMDEVPGDWKRLHIGKLHKLYPLPNIIRMIKIRNTEMGGAYSTYGGENCTGFWWRNMKERGYYLDLHVDVRIILKLTL